MLHAQNEIRRDALGHPDRLDMVEPRQQFREERPGRLPSEMRADAEMLADSEGEMRIRIPVDAKFIGCSDDPPLQALSMMCHPIVQRSSGSRNGLAQPAAGVYQMGEVQARSCWMGGMSGSEQPPGRPSSGRSRHCQAE